MGTDAKNGECNLIYKACMVSVKYDICHVGDPGQFGLIKL